MTSYIPREFFSEYTLTDSIHFSHHFFPAEKWKEEIPFDTTISSYEADFYDLVFYPDSLTYDYLFNIEIHEYPDRIDIYRPMSDEQIS